MYSGQRRINHDICILETTNIKLAWLNLVWTTDIIGGAENAGVENAEVENTGAKTYGKPSIQKSLTVEAPIRMCLIVNGRKSPISGKPNRTDRPGS